MQGDADGVGLQAAHVQEVLDQGREPGQGLSGGRDQFGALFGGPGDRAGEAVDRGGRGGERGAQVVADGGEQGAAHPVGFGEGDRFGSLLIEALLAEGDRGLHGGGFQHPAVGGGQHPTAQHENEVLVHGYFCVPLVGGPARVDPGGGGDAPPGRVAGGVRGRRAGVEAFEQGDRAHREGLPDPVEEGGQRLVSA